MTHICVGKLTIIGSDNGLSPARRQAIIWTNAGILLIGPLGTNFNELLNRIQTFSFTKNALENVICEMASISSRPQCVKNDAKKIAELTHWGLITYICVSDPGTSSFQVMTCHLFSAKPLPEPMLINTLRQRQDGRHFPDDILICIFLNENEWHSIKISLKFVPKVPINNIPVLVQIMAWRRPGDKPLSEPMMVVLPTHICVTRPQWVIYQLETWGPMV